VVGDGQGLVFTTGPHAAQLDVTSSLGHGLKAKLAQDGNDLLAGEPSKPWQVAPPTRK
jgi:hypothetical protein